MRPSRIPNPTNPSSRFGSPILEAVRNLARLPKIPRPTLGALIAAALFMGGSAPAHGAADLLKWLQKEVLDKIQLSGSRTLGYHNHTVEGDEEAFNLLTYYGYGGRRFTDVGAMNVTGRNVAGLVNFQSTIDQSRFRDPQQQRFTIDYDRKPLKVSLGDVHGGLLNTNRLASFSKLLRGGVAQYTSGNLQTKFLYSEARASARTVTLQGNNSAGPYYLNFSQIIRGSESVRVDEQPMRLGEDYVISYELGAITFVNRIIAPTSTIVVTFEALGFNSQRGTIEGAGATYDMGKAGKIGLTALRQRTGGGSGLSTRLERFQGAGPPSVPYILEFEPLRTRPITVKLDGIIQTEGLDYNFDPLNPAIFYFKRFVPLTSTIDVVYTPKPTQTLDGDRNVWGLDYRLPIGSGKHSGFLSYYQATGELDNDLNPLKGTARGLDGSYRTGHWELRASLRNVPEDFVSVETRGFNRNEEAFDYGVRYAAAPWTIDLRGTDSDIAIRTVDKGGNISFRRAKAESLRLLAGYHKDVAQPWDFEYKSLRSQSAAGDARVDTAGISTSRTFGRLITRFGLEAQDARGPVTTGPKPEIKDIRLNTARAETTYTAGSAWAFGLKGSVSAIDSGDDSGQGSDLSVNASYEPSAKFALSASYTMSDSGQLVALGAFNNGIGLGYNGNGYSGGYSGIPFTTGATDMRLFQVLARSQLNPRASLIAQYYKSRSSGSITSNSETTTYDFGFDWDLGSGHLASVSLNKSDTEFLSSPSSASATTFDVSLAGSPKGRWSYRLGANALLTGGTSEFQQDGVTFDAFLGYRLSPKERLTLNFNTGRTTGYLGQENTNFGLSYQYQIYRNVALVGSYRIREVINLDPKATGGAYRSSGFDLELTFTFGGFR